MSGSGLEPTKNMSGCWANKAPQPTGWPEASFDSKTTTVKQMVKSITSVIKGYKRECSTSALTPSTQLTHNASSPVMGLFVPFSIYF